MIATLLSMTVPIVVLLILGSLIIGLAWWLAVQAEGKDEWILGGDDRYPFKVVCPQCGMTLARASHSGVCEIRCHSNCGFEGKVLIV